MNTSKILCTTLAIFFLPLQALGYPERIVLQKEIDILEEFLRKAQSTEGPLCAPEILSTAQVLLSRAKEEFREGDYWEAEDALQLCREKIQGLQERLLACGKDIDQDRIPDERDRCPEDPEIYNGYKDTDGCPDRIPDRALLTQNKIELLEPIRFDEQNQGLLPVSVSLLEAVATILKENPGLRVRIESHLDDSLSSDQALHVTRTRAQNVKQALISMGVQEDRLEALGRGSREPIATNESPQGRKLNRRVEFYVIT